mmetsp:Transcript_99673/g.280183  ORF Transcript_99673/g.280183 Transcript_99673/m.280183 type:complete len:255 (-) Transcript_99673:43-807(-)
MSTPLGCLDQDRCYLAIDGDFCDLEGSPIFTSGYPSEGVAFEVGEGQVVMLDRLALEELLDCKFVTYVLFARARDLQSRHFWAFPPPVSPAFPFGPLQSSAAAGCEALLREGGFLYERLSIRRVGVIDGVDAGLGLFTRGSVSRGEFLGEYTGCIRERGGEEDATDDYGYALPMIDPDFVLSAARYGNLCRLINHSDDAWNSELVSVHHEGIVHVVCRTVRDLAAGEQVLIHYGAKYWDNPRRRRVDLRGTTDT